MKNNFLLAVAHAKLKDHKQPILFRKTSLVSMRSVNNEWSSRHKYVFPAHTVGPCGLALMKCLTTAIRRELEPN